MAKLRGAIKPHGPMPTLFTDLSLILLTLSLTVLSLLRSRSVHTVHLLCSHFVHTVQELLEPAAQVASLLHLKQREANVEPDVAAQVVSQTATYGDSATDKATHAAKRPQKRARRQQSAIEWSVGRAGPCSLSVGDRDVTLCKRADKGALTVKWKSFMNKCVDASPLVLCEHGVQVIVIGSHAHIVRKIRASDGHCLWVTQLGDRVESSAAASDDGLAVFVGCYDAKLYCLELADGAVRWTVSTGAEVKCSPVSDPSSGLVVFGSHDGLLRAARQVDGHLVWILDTRGAIYGSPALLRVEQDWEDWVLSNTKGKVMCWHIDPSGQKHPTEEWCCSLPAPVFSTPCIVKAVVCTGCADGAVYGICTQTGRVLWQVHTSEPVFSSPCSNSRLDSDSRCWVGSHDGILRCIDCIRGSTLWEVRFPNTGLLPCH